MRSLRDRLLHVPPPRSASADANRAPDAARDATKLEALRAQMDAMLAHPPARARQGRDVESRVPHGGGRAAASLAFTTEETDEGPVHVRRTVYGATHRVGATEMAPFARASSELLSLLALDPALADLAPSGALFFDTETTGLSGGTGTVAFLIGLAFLEGDDVVVEQYFLEELGDERPMLARVRDRVRDATMLISYNGKSFDAPLLRTRFMMARLEAFPERPHLDLLHVARRVHKEVIPHAERTRRALRLCDLERDVLGLERVGDVAGAEVSACYMHFLRSGDEEVLRAVVDHNAWDVLSMVALAGLYGEPLEDTRLRAGDLPGVARTLQKAGDLTLAASFAGAAVSRANDTSDRAAALYARAEVQRARGDRASALLDLEALAEDVDVPAVRLRLAQLYEHHVRDYEAALRAVERGTGERESAAERRAARLMKKQARVLAPAAPKTPRARARAHAPAAQGDLDTLLLRGKK
jgi:hypothetical protein